MEWIVDVLIFPHLNLLPKGEGVSSAEQALKHYFLKLSASEGERYIQQFFISSAQDLAELKYPNLYLTFDLIL